MSDAVAISLDQKIENCPHERGLDFYEKERGKVRGLFIIFPIIDEVVQDVGRDTAVREGDFVYCKKATV